MKKGTAETPETHRRKTIQGFEHWHMVAVLLILYDLSVVFGAYFAALWLGSTAVFLKYHTNI